MKQYLLAVHMNADTPPPSHDDMLAMYESVGVFNAELQAAGGWVFAGGLYPPSSATVVHARDGEVVTTDGPFAETKEQLGGIWIIDAADLDAALAWAGKASAACGAPVEVRPFQELPE
jgi:hypothetical protein